MQWSMPALPCPQWDPRRAWSKVAVLLTQPRLHLHRRFHLLEAPSSPCQQRWRHLLELAVAWHRTLAMPPCGAVQCRRHRLPSQVMSLPWQPIKAATRLRDAAVPVSRCLATTVQQQAPQEGLQEAQPQEQRAWPTAACMVVAVGSCWALTSGQVGSSCCGAPTCCIGAASRGSP